MVAAEVWPQHIREDELAVGELPQQEVRDAVLAGRANHHVGVRHAWLVQVLADRLLGDLVRRHFRFHDRLHRVDDLRAPAIVERDRERHSSIAFGERF